LNGAQKVLDPRFRGILHGEDHALSRFAADKTPALILAHGTFDEQQLRALGVDHIVRLTDTIWSIRFTPNKLEEIKKLPLIKYVEAPNSLSPLLTKSVAEINARPQDLQDIEPAIDGSNVVIGIIDYGIDWTIPDFCEENGERTRIKYLWDQSLRATAGERGPKGFGWGVEYCQGQIDAARAHFRAGKIEEALSMVRHRPWPARNEEAADVDGHGTHVTGIASGNGASSSAHCFECPASAGKYRGVAPRSWIVFVHLNRERILRHVQRGEGGLGNSVDLAEGIAYCFRKADEISEELRKNIPCVVNLSMGFNGGSHDGESLVEWVIDSMLEVRGRALVAAAGNQRQERTHYCGTVEAKRPYALQWNMGYGHQSDPTANEMEIWYSSKEVFKVQLIAPDGTSTKVVTPGERISCDLDADIGAVIDSERFTYLNSDARIYVCVSPRNGKGLLGTWTLELTCDSPEEGSFDAWIERKAGRGTGTGGNPIQSRFPEQNLRPDQRATTLLAPGTSRRVITVGAVGRLDRSIPRVSEDSSAGPTRDGRRKPELVAPGVDICSNNVQFDRGAAFGCAQVKKTGTSMSCPHIAGVAALILQVNPNLTATQVQQILVASAEHVGGRKGFDPLWGFGVVNAHRAVEFAKQYF
jgi:subtilisin family serine protease